MKKLYINNNCIGCGMCVSFSSKVFDFKKDGYVGIVNFKNSEEKEQVLKKEEQNIQMAIENCPARAIIKEP